MSVQNTRSIWLALASLLGLLAVVLGAFGAHSLEKILDPALLKRYHTGVEYQFYHSLALLGVGLWFKIAPSKLLSYAGLLFTLGIILFSGSLYVYALSGIKTFGMITPLGGIAFIAGWALMLYTAWTT
ncbi:MAG: DUF423 domain-containing protein [Thiofilum sp.]|uniref:DUF423 domain-containing protein n=1 Tax=Thiofilum sp. TaxID=2212733 RepID=UPI0025F6F1D2|nr:DUF423 domain-containing protein [Thiofilum sp.]MBK8453715.1 DUF423 domain-containing protein [Thiofilum sp.]